MLAAHLRDLADAAGGIRPLARVLGVHWTTVHRWLAGTQVPPPLTARYLRALTAGDVRSP